MIIDFHTHLFPDALAKKTIPYLADKSGFINQTDGTVSGTLENMKKSGVAKSVILNIATNARQTGNVNDFAIEVDKTDNFISFGSIHPDSDYICYLDKLKSNGIKGIKLHPDYQNFFIDDIKMQNIYEEILKREFVLIFHCGMDDGIGLPVHATPRRIKNVMGLFRGEKIVLAHMGGFRMWDEVCEDIIGEDVFLDTSCANYFIPESRFCEMIKNHGCKKILFATDLPWTDPIDGIEFINNLNISEEEKQDIFCKNAMELLKL